MFALDGQADIKTASAIADFDFPDMSENFAVLANLFPVVLVREIIESGCGTGVFVADIVSMAAKTTIFPVKFPVSREFGWRPVRVSTASPASQSLDLRLSSIFARKPCKYRVVSHNKSVSETTSLGNLNENIRKVSDPNRGNSRF
jgi:hypothetical protein